ncbi:DUF5677 domain-containing protein [Richelia sinica]|nr:DUF5677 domain-containing protein [Richelia sinica]MBD2666293.1 hypothetical protein [Richelia sinica FACHB-800]
MLNQSREDPQNVDFPSVAILTRGIFESYRNFYYLTSEAGISDSEFEFRYLIFKSYGNFEKQDMIKKLKAENIDIMRDFQVLEEELDELKEDIINNEFYQQIKIENEKNKRYKKIQDKQLFSERFKEAVIDTNGCFISHKKILLKRFIELNNGYEQYKQKIEARYEFLYKYLSNFVHVSPFSLDQPHHHISIDEFKKIFLPIIFYLNIANEDILNDFPELEERLQVTKNYSNIFKGLEEFIKWLKCDIIN